jgi:hypothetical protein
VNLDLKNHLGIIIGSRIII